MATKFPSLELEPEATPVRRAIIDLIDRYKDNCAYPYRQSALLAKGNEGACFGMSMDWLRRNMFNLDVLNGKFGKIEGKRNFDDPKYNKLGKRKRLTNKHVELQEVYEKFKGDRIVETQAVINAMAGATSGRFNKEPIVKSLQSLQAVWPESERLLNSDNLGRVFRRLLEKYVGKAVELMEPRGTGILMAIDFSDRQHHATVFLVEYYVIRFFDPNVGEFFFLHEDYDKLGGFVLELLQRFYQPTGLKFEWVVFGEDHPIMKKDFEDVDV
jgi:hypothetical protein